MNIRRLQANNDFIGQICNSALRQLIDQNRNALQSHPEKREQLLSAMQSQGKISIKRMMRQIDDSATLSVERLHHMAETATRDIVRAGAKILINQ